MKHLKMITALSICSFLLTGSEVQKNNTLESIASSDALTEEPTSKLDSNDSETNNSLREETTSDSDSNDSLAKEIIYPIIFRSLILSEELPPLEKLAKQGNLKEFAKALSEGEKPSEQRWIHSINFDPTQKTLEIFPKDPWVIQKVNLKEFLTMSTTTCSAGLISFPIAEKMLKMLDVASTQEWSKLNKEERFSKLIAESAKKEDKA